MDGDENLYYGVAIHEILRIIVGTRQSQNAYPGEGDEEQAKQFWNDDSRWDAGCTGHQHVCHSGEKYGGVRGEFLR